MVYYATFYGSEKKICFNASCDEDAMGRIFKAFPEHAETDGEDIEFCVTEENLYKYNVNDFKHIDI